MSGVLFDFGSRSLLFGGEVAFLTGFFRGRPTFFGVEAAFPSVVFGLRPVSFEDDEDEPSILRADFGGLPLLFGVAVAVFTEAVSE